MDELLGCLNKNEFVTCERVEKDEFFDFLEWQDKFYRTPTGGEFKKNHVFIIKKSKATVLVKKDDWDSEEAYDNLIPNRRSRKAMVLSKATRKLAIAQMTNELKVLKPPGLREIKAVEMFTKWRNVVPNDHRRDIICPRPSEEIMKRVKEEKNKKVRDSTKRKKDKNNKMNKKRKVGEPLQG